MRPHRLWITAFGSFPGEEEIDFDALAEAGLFLIHGPTGAGKTTVLDALCYALYGRVPGRRDNAKSLRCDHAPPGRGPSVALEVTLRGRRLRITRSPAWQRPKLRGEGTTRENERALVQELTPSGEWSGLTTRVDEAGDLIGTLLGMNADQFFQVAMLPQGDFARFLRADGEDRRRVLERLFSVKVYAGAESWLADRRTEAHREQQALRTEVDFAVKRIEEAAGPELLALIEEEPDPEDPLGWAAALEALAADAEDRAGRDGDGVTETVRLTRTALERGTALADRRRRHAEALVRERALEETAQERADLEAVLAEAARADRVLPMIRAAEQREETATKAHRMAADAVARTLPLAENAEALDPRATTEGDAVRPGVEVSSERLTAMALERREEITRLEELRAQEPLLLRAVQERETLVGQIAELGDRQKETDARLTVLPGLRREAEVKLAAARLDAARIPAAEAVRDAAQARLRAAKERDGLATALEEARRHLAVALQAVPDHDNGDEACTRELLVAREREHGRLLAGLEGLRGDEARLTELARLLAELDAEITEAAEREKSLTARCAELPARLAEVAARLTEAGDRAAEIPEARARADAASVALDAARRRDGLRADLETARARLTEAVDLAQRLRDRHQDLRQARIDGMAAELAAKLVPGEPCAVCGSPEHPHPAARSGQAPTAEDERAAQDAYDAAADQRGKAETTVATLTSRLEEALAIAGETPVEEAREALDEVRRALALLAEVAGTRAVLQEEAERVTAELDEARAGAEDAARLLARSRARQEEWRAEQDRLTARLDEARGTDPTVQARRERLTLEAALFAAAAEAAGRAAELAAAHREAAEETDVETEQAVRELARAREVLAALTESARAESALAEEAERTATEQAGLEELSRELAVTLAAGRTREERLAEDVERLTALLDGARGEDPTLADRIDRLADEAGLLTEAVEATRLERTATAELAAARVAAAAAAVEAGFSGVEDAKAAVRPSTEQEEKAERLRGLERERAAVAALLADPELVAASAEPEPDLDGLRAARDAAETAQAGLLSAANQAKARLARLVTLRAELAGCLDLWRPARRRHRVAESLAALTGGTSGDNRWKMRLSAYVLGERLRQVVDSANERLDRMSGGRYLLEHGLGRTAGDRSRSGGGLGLRIVDGWTGNDRDPATLSGGESFITSLALALGLADVVSAEAGGVELGALFIDEGFGTLDEETLDGVLDILDGLRDGGRAVGIVSHVTELRARVPAQLRVNKGRRGSTVEVSVP
ncbi:AAA family ATPase [Streptosporangium saharense]|uniref:Nuclease SbcCD subunit C n=1 Tax=Streptosporangium saharense TaxID=1706840 RepID=A0A7W7VNV6_9ACTN|nr:AAA family ATPase [Streptosporangium saharense]MBB4916650.1 exonuclease SbcC [Streptosporangium saharense]